MLGSPAQNWAALQHVPVPAGVAPISSSGDGAGNDEMGNATDSPSRDVKAVDGAAPARGTKRRLGEHQVRFSCTLIALARVSAPFQTATHELSLSELSVMAVQAALSCRADRTMRSCMHPGSLAAGNCVEILLRRVPCAEEREEGELRVSPLLRTVPP